jgi:hypothetical protein
MAVAVVLTGAYMVARDGRRRASNLAAPPVSVTMLKVALIAVAAVTVDTLARRGRAAQ